jgi:signal peptidase
MSEQGSSDEGRSRVDPSRSDPDRAWWAEPDPVDLFASGLELAIRQLHVEVAGLRAERDGLRLEVEGLRAKLSIAQEQLAARDGLAETVRQLQAVVARLTLRGDMLTLAPDPDGTPAPSTPVASTPSLTSPVVLPETPTVTPFVVAEPAPFRSPEPPIVIEPMPIVTAAPLPAPEPAPEPSAIDQLKAMGMWPPRAGAAVAPPVDATPPAPATPSPPAPVAADPVLAPPAPPVFEAPAAPAEREEAPPRIVPEREPVVWDRISTRRTPVLSTDEPIDDVDDADDPVPASSSRVLLKRVGSVLGVLVIILVMAVTVGPRFLPYQTYFVRSGSMRPTIDVGAMVVLTKVDANSLDVGDIITFDNPDKPGTLVTHRIAGIEQTDTGRVFTTKGDANAVQDSWQVPATGDGWKYAFDVPLLGYAFGYLGTPQARLALLAVPGVILGFLTLMDIWKPEDGKSSKKKGAKAGSRR